MTLENREFPRDVAIIGTYPPRQCGIATFTSDVVSALAKAKPDLNILAVPINDREQGYPYGSPVRFEIAERDIDAYRRAADFLNINGVDITVLQHEFGIFGGKAGSHILTFLRELHMPLVSVLHTVLREPDRAQKRVLSEICRLSDRVVVMSHLASDFLTETYEVPKERIAVIPHGIPDVPFVDPNFYKDQFGAAGKVVLLTFGLLSPSKGIENVIEALPKIREKVPD
ncbi:MAG TPA: glycosyltransferase, partial [Ktedonobacterales bacterium]